MYERKTNRQLVELVIMVKKLQSLGFYYTHEEYLNQMTPMMEVLITRGKFRLYSWAIGRAN